MTTHQYQRCEHCRRLYTFQGSGPGCHDPLNDSRFCSDCKQTVITALSAVPVRFERVWEPTNDYTVPQLLELAAKAERLAAEQAFEKRHVVMPRGRRVGVPLFNMETGESDRSGFVRVLGKHYQYRYWPGKESEGQVTIELEKNLETGELVPWYEPSWHG